MKHKQTNIRFEKQEVDQKCMCRCLAKIDSEPSNERKVIEHLQL